MKLKNFVSVVVALACFQAGAVLAEDAAPTTPQTAAAPAADPIPTQTVKNLTFKITSLRIGSWPRTASIWITVTNNGTTPVALNYNGMHDSIFVNEYGDKWYYNSVSGVGYANASYASMDYVVPPGGELRATINMINSGIGPSQSNGNTFNFQTEFLSYRDLGGGRLQKDQLYPVSFVGIHESSIVGNAKDQVENAGGRIKNAFKSLCGN